MHLCDCHPLTHPIPPSHHINLDAHPLYQPCNAIYQSLYNTFYQPPYSTTKVPYDVNKMQVLINAQIDVLKALVPQPDLLLWCDNQASTNDLLVPYLFPLPLMKAKNYLPKALSVLDALDNDLMSQFGSLTDYLVASDVISHGLSGSDFTEGEQPYSNYFRPPNPVWIAP